MAGRLLPLGGGRSRSSNDRTAPRLSMFVRAFPVQIRGTCQTRAPPGSDSLYPDQNAQNPLRLRNQGERSTQSRTCGREIGSAGTGSLTTTSAPPQCPPRLSCDPNAGQGGGESPRIFQIQIANQGQREIRAEFSANLLGFAVLRVSSCCAQLFRAPFRLCGPVEWR
jgi:hypothetical protein